MLLVVAGECGGVSYHRSAGNLDRVLQFVGERGDQTGLRVRNVDGDAEMPGSSLGAREFEPPGHLQEASRHIHD